MDFEARKIQKYTVSQFYDFVQNYNSLAELRNGEIVNLASPNRLHQKISLALAVHIFNFIKNNNGKCEVYTAPTDVKLDELNVVVPDVFVVCNPDNFDNQKYNGPPDWIIEIVSNNWADDYIRKLNLYKDCGVREYWIVDPDKNLVTVYFFESLFIRQFHFSDNIPVNIYDNLIVNFNNLLT